MSSDEDDGPIVLQVSHELSDGQTSSWPAEEKWAMSEDIQWRRNLATMWVNEGGAVEKGMYAFLCYRA